LATSPRVINKLENLTGLSEQERQLLQPVTETFAFRVSPYYASLIDWSDERDPLRKSCYRDRMSLKASLFMTQVPRRRTPWCADYSTNIKELRCCW